MNFWSHCLASLVNWSLDSTLAYDKWGWGVIPVQKESEGLGKQWIEMVLLLDGQNIHSGFSHKNLYKNLNEHSHQLRICNILRNSKHSFGWYR